MRGAGPAGVAIVLRSRLLACARRRQARRCGLPLPRHPRCGRVRAGVACRPFLQTRTRCPARPVQRSGSGEQGRRVERIGDAVRAPAASPAQPSARRAAAARGERSGCARQRPAGHPYGTVPRLDQLEECRQAGLAPHLRDRGDGGHRLTLLLARPVRDVADVAEAHPRPSPRRYGPRRTRRCRRHGDRLRAQARVERPLAGDGQGPHATRATRQRGPDGAIIARGPRSGRRPTTTPKRGSLPQRNDLIVRAQTNTRRRPPGGRRGTGTWCTNRSLAIGGASRQLPCPTCSTRCGHLETMSAWPVW